jgi:hypothetical protein
MRVMPLTRTRDVELAAAEALDNKRLFPVHIWLWNFEDISCKPPFEGFYDKSQ